MHQAQLPVPPAPPSPDVVITSGGRSIHVGQNAQAAYLAALTESQRVLEGARSTLQSQLTTLPANSANSLQLQAEVAQISQQIATIEQTIAIAQVGQLEEPAQYITVPPPFVAERALPKDIFVLSGVFIVCVLLPLAVATSMRILRRGAAKVAALPSEFAERLGRMESAIESTAIEVERIGEGQRYITRVLGDRKADELLERPRPVAPYRVITPH